MNARVSRREFLHTSAALLVGFSMSAPVGGQRVPQAETVLGKTLDATDVDGFIGINRDGSITVYSGKVDLGQGLRIAIPQMAAEELGVGVDRILLVEGDTALTPDQGATGGSTGIMRGGVQIRQAAATARQALVELAAKRSGKSADAFDIIDGEVRETAGGASYRFSDLVAEQRLALKSNPKAKLRDPSSYKVVGKPLPRPDIPNKVSGRHRFLHDFKLDGMLHARVIRAPANGANLVEVDEASVNAIPGAKIVRVKNLLAVVANDEWDAICAARLVKAQWSEATPLIGSDAVRGWLRNGPFESEETLVKKGDARQALASAKKVSAEFYWPVQSHASLEPSCAIAVLLSGRSAEGVSSSGSLSKMRRCSRSNRSGSM